MTPSARTVGCICAQRRRLPVCRIPKQRTVHRTPPAYGVRRADRGRSSSRNYRALDPRRAQAWRRRCISASVPSASPRSPDHVLAATENSSSKIRNSCRHITSGCASAIRSRERGKRPGTLLRLKVAIFTLADLRRKSAVASYRCQVSRKCSLVSSWPRTNHRRRWSQTDPLGVTKHFYLVAGPLHRFRDVPGEG